MHRALVGCAVAASTAVVLTAAPSLAQSRTMDDGTGDVWSQGSQPLRALRGVPTTEYHQVGGRVNVDLTSTEVSHTAHAVSATATYDSLVRNTDSFEYEMLLRTDDHQKFWIIVGATPDDRDGAFALLRPTDGSVEKVKCSRKEHKVNYAKDKITFSIPRSCLGRPTWVRYESAGAANDESNTYFIDDAASDQAVPSTWSAKLHQD